MEGYISGKLCLVLIPNDMDPKVAVSKNCMMMMLGIEDFQKHFALFDEPLKSIVETDEISNEQLSSDSSETCYAGSNEADVETNPVADEVIDVSSFDIEDLDKSQSLLEGYCKEQNYIVSQYHACKRSDSKDLGRGTNLKDNGAKVKKNELDPHNKKATKKPSLKGITDGKLRRKKSPHDNNHWYDPDNDQKRIKKIYKSDQKILEYVKPQAPVDETKLTKAQIQKRFQREQDIKRYNNLPKTKQDEALKLARENNLHIMTAISDTPTNFWDNNMPTTQEMSVIAISESQLKRFENN